MLYCQFCQHNVNLKHVDVCKEHAYHMEQQGKRSKRLKKEEEELNFNEKKQELEKKQIS